MKSRQAAGAALLASMLAAVTIVVAVSAGNESQLVGTAGASPVLRPVVVLDESTTTTTVATTTTVPPTTTTTVPPVVTTSTVITEPPPPPPPPAPRPSGGCAGWEEEIAAEFPAEQVGKACSVMMCESGGDPMVSNHGGSGASGLFQFMPGTWESTTGLAAPAANYPPQVQIAAAATLWSRSGWSPWACA